ncbi:MAG: sigma 54-interacting transcriptional regulator [Deltaproteobacteria bacterium]|jgi:transcriptional regulator with GAF, ATPase, and Fis domain
MTNPADFEEAAPTVSVRGDLTAALTRRDARLRIGGESRVEPVEGPTTIGSAPGADLRVTDKTVSRLHARLEPREDGIWVVDLDSTNGTFVENVRVGSALLHDHARIRCGQLELELRYATDETVVPLWPSDRFGPLVGRSTPMRELFERLSKFAKSEATALVTGETGTGKDLVARAIHEHSSRARGPFVVFDCAAVPEALFESELFGHARGAFTGADRAREGAVQAAAGGTLFLDEIGELPLSMQPKLLRFLESRTVRRVGESDYRGVDVRVLAATHRDLARMVAGGSFREDLYFRLAVLPVTVPPLRARRGDIAALAQHFLGERALDATTLREIDGRPWLGNVRELRSFVERAVALGADEALRMIPGTQAPAGLPPVPLDEPFKDVRERWNDHLERGYLAGWIERKGHNVSAVADAIGLDRTYVHRLLKKHGLSR